jgi:hypothetical protein
MKIIFPVGASCHLHIFNRCELKFPPYTVHMAHLQEFSLSLSFSDNIYIYNGEEGGGGVDSKLNYYFSLSFK